MSKIAVVFGGHGFIGSHLVKTLAASGDYVRVVSADIAAEPRFRTPGVDYVICDVCKPIPADFVPGVSEIYNFAAVHTTPGHEDWQYFWTNVLGATNVCDFARANDVDAIVFTSSISVYGPSEAELTEESQLEPESAYGRSKFCAERIHHQWRNEFPDRRRLIVARPSVVFGFQERGNFTRLAALLKRGRFVYPGRTDTIKACVYVKDVVESLRYFLDQSIPTITYNVAYTERYTTKDICAAFVRVTGYNPPRHVIPIWVMLLGGLVFEIIGNLGFQTSINRARVLKLFRSTNIVPKRLDESGYARAYTLDAAIADWRNDSASAEFE